MLAVAVVAAHACLASLSLAAMASAGDERIDGSIAEPIVSEASQRAAGASGDHVSACCRMHCFDKAISRSRVDLEITAVSPAEFHDSAVLGTLCLSRSLRGESTPEGLRLKHYIPTAHSFILRIRPLLI